MKKIMLNAERYNYKFLKTFDNNLKYLTKEEGKELENKQLKNKIYIKFDFINYKNDYSKYFIVDEIEKKIYMIIDASSDGYDWSQNNYFGTDRAYLIDLEYNEVLNGLKRYAKY